MLLVLLCTITITLILLLTIVDITITIASTSTIDTWFRQNLVVAGESPGGAAQLVPDARKDAPLPLSH